MLKFLPYTDSQLPTWPNTDLHIDSQFSCESKIHAQETSRVSPDPKQPPTNLLLFLVILEEVEAELGLRNSCSNQLGKQIQVGFGKGVRLSRILK